MTKKTKPHHGIFLLSFFTFNFRGVQRAQLYGWKRIITLSYIFIFIVRILGQFDTLPVILLLGAFHPKLGKIETPASFNSPLASRGLRVMRDLQSGTCTFPTTR